MSFYLSLLVLLVANQITATTEKYDEETYLPKWRLLEKNLKHLSQDFASKLRPHFVEVARQRNLTSQCVEQSMQVLSGMEDLKLWAMRFLDSSAKPIDGILDTTLVSFGRYDECLSTVVTGEALRNERSGHRGFTGQYCLMALKPHVTKMKYFPFGEPAEELRNISEADSALSVLAKHSNYFIYLTMLFGVCVPSGCDRQDVDKLASYVGEQNGIIITSESCEIREENQYTPTFIAIIACYSFVIFLVIVGTSLEAYEKRRPTLFSNTKLRFLLAFSVTSNFRNLFATKTSEGSVKCLNALRVLSIFWVIICHAYSSRPMQLFHSMISLGNTVMSFFYQIMINGTFAVDTFFFISGFLVSYKVKRYNMTTNKFITFPQYIILRLCRLYPSLLFIVSLYILAPLLTSGPTWKMTYSTHIQPCNHAWWSKLIFINNFYDYKHMCASTLWYVACDMQLYIFAFFFLALLIKKKKLGVASSIIAILAAMTYAATVTYMWNHPPTLTYRLFYDNEVGNVAYRLYYLPMDHVGPYFIGILTGIFLATKREMTLSKVTLTFGWILAIMTNMTVMFGVLPWNSGKEASIAVAVMYASCSRVLWALSVAWIVVCCASGYGGIINYILSWNMWIPLSRLTFSAYLVHHLLQLATRGSVDTVLSSKKIFLLRGLIADITISYVCAIPVFLAVEAPFGNVARLLFLNRSEPKKDETILQTCASTEK